MRFNVLNRKVHYWAAAIIAIPLLVIICSGLLLQAKKQSAWVQPPEKRGTGKAPVITLDEVLDSVKQVPDMHVKSWDDVNRLDVRPGRGLVKVWLQNGYEVQVDLGTGKVLQVAYRRSDFIESIHDGSFFAGDWTKLGLFLPTGLTLLLMWLGGVWMWWVPFWAKRKRTMAARFAKTKTASGTVAMTALLAIAPAALLASHAIEQSPSTSLGAGKPLQVVPIVGHWEHHADEGQPVVIVDSTKWNQKAAKDFDGIGKRLFKAPNASFVSNATSDDAFPIASVEGVEDFTGGTIRVRFKLISGASDQIAGLVFNMRPGGEYFVVRYNTKDGNVAFWKYADGKRARVADGADHAQLALGAWHDLELRVSGRTVTGIVNGKLRAEHTLDQPVSGRIGFWSKRDSVSAFKDLHIEPASTR